MTPELFKDIQRAYAEELRAGYSTWSSEHDGKLHLGIDAREEMKHKHIAPIQVGYEAYEAVFDANGACTTEDEVSIVIPFMDSLEENMRAAENEFIEFILSGLNLVLTSSTK